MRWKYKFILYLILQFFLTSCSTSKTQQSLTDSTQHNLQANNKAESPTPPNNKKCNSLSDNEKQSLVPRINIKGFYLGMNECEIKESIEPINQYFSIAGIIVGEPLTQFKDGKLSLFHVQFPSSKFGDMQDAINAKYPDLVCEKSQLENAFGAKFEQISCHIDYELGRLMLVKFSSGIQKSSLSLLSKEEAEKKNREKLRKQKDL